MLVVRISVSSLYSYPKTIQSMVAGISFITYLLIVFGAITSIEALKWDGVQSTSLSSSPGWNPLPTSKPQIGTAAVLLGSNNLRRGQAMGAICGYINGLTGNYKSS